MKQSENHYKISSGLKFIYQTYLSDLCYFWQGDIEVCYETEIT